MKTPSRHLMLLLLRTYLAPYWRSLLMLLLLLVTATGLTLVSPRILAAFIDVVFGRSDRSLWMLGVAFLGIALVSQCITIATNYLGTDTGLRATNRLRTDIMLHCLELDMSFHNATTPGELIERIDGDVGRLNEFFSTFAVTLLNNALVIVGALTAIALIDWRAGLVAAGCTVVTLFTLEATRRLGVPRWREERERSAQLFGTLEERIAGIEDMRANGGTGYVMQRFTEQSRHWARATMFAHVIGGSTWQAANVLYAVTIALTLGTAAWLVNGGAITIGAAYALYRYIELLRNPINQIGRQIQHLQQVTAAITRLSELFARRTAIEDRGTQTLDARPVAVRFEDVVFAYPDAIDDQGTAASHALCDLSFTLERGRTLGLLGRTGSGKTTLARLLLRFYEPQQGTISLDGTPMDGIALRSLRERVGLVTQDVQIFNASVRDNLSLFDPAITDARMHEALEAVTLTPWLHSLPEGLDTVLPPGGGISGGQAQLLAVARVLLRDPALVILDEASSRLDPATERRLDDAFERLLHGRTAIVIAHRLQTVLRADNIMILEHGRCLEWGERAALQANPDSRFSHLLQAGMEEALA